MTNAEIAHQCFILFGGNGLSSSQSVALIREMLDKERPEGHVALLRGAVQGVINSAVHPDVAVRAMMVPLEPLRSVLKATDTGVLAEVPVVVEAGK